METDELELNEFVILHRRCKNSWTQNKIYLNVHRTLRKPKKTYENSRKLWYSQRAGTYLSWSFQFSGVPTFVEEHWGAPTCMILTTSEERATLLQHQSYNLGGRPGSHHVIEQKDIEGISSDIMFCSLA
eukprot:gene22445-biopygen957